MRCLAHRRTPEASPGPADVSSEEAGDYLVPEKLVRLAVQLYVEAVEVEGGGSGLDAAEQRKTGAIIAAGADRRPHRT